MDSLTAKHLGLEQPFRDLFPKRESFQMDSRNSPLRIISTRFPTLVSILGIAHRGLTCELVSVANDLVCSKRHLEGRMLSLLTTRARVSLHYSRFNFSVLAREILRDIPAFLPE